MHTPVVVVQERRQQAATTVHKTTTGQSGGGPLVTNKINMNMKKPSPNVPNGPGDGQNWKRDMADEQKRVRPRGVEPLTSRIFS